MRVAIYSQPAAEPQFEVASVRIAAPSNGELLGAISLQAGRLRARAATLEQLIEIAFDLDTDGFRIFGPSWIWEARYDVLTNSPEATAWPQVRPMMRALLIDRFHLKVHRETRVFPTYQLVVAEGGPKFRETAEKRLFYSTPTNGGVRLVANGASIGDLFPYLRPHLDGHPLVDNTGLKGKYDLALEFAPTSPLQRRSAMEQSGITSDEGFTFPILSTALREQLGLRLIRGNAPFEVIVIDSVDRAPTEN